MEHTTAIDSKQKINTNELKVEAFSLEQTFEFEKAAKKT